MRFTVTVIEATCDRCGQTRYPPREPMRPYLCIRCLAVMAGRNVEDPIPAPPTEAQTSARKANLRPFGHGKPGLSPSGNTET